ncbi:MAG: DNA polymerase III subunit beta, partial [Pseudomonadota bacterium]
MKAVLPRTSFLDALHAAASLTGGRTTNPILSCVKLATVDDSVEISATDGEAALRLRVPALAVEQPGETVVSADRLLNIVREMTDVEIQIEVDDRHFAIRGAGSSFRIFVKAVADFPPVPTVEGEPDLVVRGAELRSMIELTLYAAARETSRYAINGVLWEKRGKKLFMVATDGRRLARSGGTLEQAGAG